MFPIYKPHLWKHGKIWCAGWTRENGAAAYGFTPKDAWDAFMTYVARR